MEWLRSIMGQGYSGNTNGGVLELEKETASVKRAMVSTFAFGLDLCDQEIGVLDHCARVAILAARIGQRMGISEADAYVLQTAARLHEMGLVSVASEPVLRRGTLSSEEVGAIRGHAAVGAGISRSMHNPRVAMLISSQFSDHLELQKTLSADDLLLAGILHVADVIAALTWPRPYQAGLTVELQVKLLESGSGNRFHPLAALCAAELRIADAAELALESAA